MIELIDSDGERYYFFTHAGANQFMENFLLENPRKEIHKGAALVPVEQVIAHERAQIKRWC